MRFSPQSRKDYIWTPIDNETEFRLLTVSPEEGRKVATSMTVHRRDSAPPYEAMSYTWDNQKRDKVIHCNGQRLLVTKNCKRALQTLRTRRLTYLKDSEDMYDRTGKEYIWIDAICINQDDSAERSAQVAVMADIFRNAWETVVYLGTCPTVQTRAGERIDQVALFQRPWFTRTWIVQEVMSSQVPFVLFDDRELSWMHLEDSRRNESKKWRDAHNVRVPEIIAMRQAMVLQPEDFATQDLSTSVRYPFIKQFEHEVRPLSVDSRGETQSQRERRINGLKYTFLLEMLDKTKEFGCTDPRDKLFGIISLFEKPTPPELAPDYSKTVEQVYMDLTWYFIQRNDFMILSFRAGWQRSAKLPSWVVDWEHDSLLYSKLTNADSFAPESSVLGRNAGFWKGQDRIYARREGRSIVVRGLLIDTLGSFFSGTTLISTGDSGPGTARYHSGPINVRADDCVVILLGFATPFVLRPMYDDTWILLGECVVNELMSGGGLRTIEEVPEMSEEPTAPLQDFKIC